MLTAPVVLSYCSQRAAIHSLVETLEAATPSPEPLANHLGAVAGEWRLLYTTVQILGSKRTKLGLRNFVQLGEFVQVLLPLRAVHRAGGLFYHPFLDCRLPTLSYHPFLDCRLPTLCPRVSLASLSLALHGHLRDLKPSALAPNVDGLGGRGNSRQRIDLEKSLAINEVAFFATMPPIDGALPPISSERTCSISSLKLKRGMSTSYTPERTLPQADQGGLRALMDGLNRDT